MDPIDQIKKRLLQIDNELLKHKEIITNIDKNISNIEREKPYAQSLYKHHKDSITFLEAEKKRLKGTIDE